MTILGIVSIGVLAIGFVMGLLALFIVYFGEEDDPQMRVKRRYE